MDVEQVTSALAQHDADPHAVMAAFQAKHRAAVRNRTLAVGALLVAAAATAVAVVVQRPLATSQSASDGCAVVSLQETLAMARQSGASVIVAKGSLSGRTAVDGQVYYEMALRSVGTLSGPAVSSGSSGWIDSGRGPAGPIPGADSGALWATDGSLFAIAWPARETGTAVGPILRIAPLSAGQVIFSSAGCWDATGLPSQPFHGSLTGIPGSDSYTRAASNGFHAVALTTVEGLIAK